MESKHTCTALILHCMDFRLGKPIKEYLEKHGLLGDCDIVSIAGASKNLARPKQDTDLEFALRQIHTSAELHHIQKVILMNHTDCGAYGGRTSPEDSESQHIADMRAAKQEIQTVVRVVNLALARIDNNGKVDIVEID
jgi:carbonic anhydrase